MILKAIALVLTVAAPTALGAAGRRPMITTTSLPVARRSTAALCRYSRLWLTTKNRTKEKRWRRDYPLRSHADEGRLGTKIYPPVSSQYALPSNSFRDRQRFWGKTATTSKDCRSTCCFFGFRSRRVAFQHLQNN